MSLGTLNASGQQGVSLGGTVYSAGNASISSGAGTVAVGGTLSSPGTITVSAAQDATVAGAVHSGGDTAVSAGGNVALNGGLEADGIGNATVTAGGNITGSGAINVANNATLTARNSIAVTGAIATGNNLSASAAQNLSTGAITAVGSAVLAATNGSATLAGDAVTGCDLTVTVGTDINTQGSVESLGNLSLDAQRGNLAANGPVESAGTANLSAAQNLVLNGQTTILHAATLSATNITTQGLAVGGNLTATATGNLDTSAGQLNAAYDPNAPMLMVAGNATLSGTNVTTANAAIGGTYSATGTTSLTTGGTAAYQGNATLAGGTVTNVGNQMAAGNLVVSGTTVTNHGALSSLQTATVNATDLINSGSIYGANAGLNVANSTVNTGAMLATNILTLRTNSLDNSNGLIFAGDVNNPASGAGDVTVNVSGGNGSLNNTSGQILGFNSVSLYLPNQVIDPSSPASGMVNGANALNLSALAVNNSGSWTLPGTAVNVTAGQGITNTGTIGQAAGSLTFNGDVSNTGTVSAQDLTINGSLANAAGATVQADDAFALNGSGTNAGTLEALNALHIAGASYDNSNGVTKAGDGGAGAGNMTISLTSDLGNAGGTLTATNDLAITANDVNNSTASGSTTTTTTTTTVINNTALLMALNVGSDTVDDATLYGGENGFCCDIAQTPQTVTLADALSPNGTATGIVVDMAPVLPGSPPVATSGPVTFVEIPTVVGTNAAGADVVQNLWFVQTPTNAGMGIATKTVALPTATETTTTTGSQPRANSVIAAGHNLNVTANALNNQGGTVSAGNDASLNLQSLSNGGSTYSSTVTDTIDMASINGFLSQAPSTISIWNNFYGANAVGPYTQGYYIDPAGIALNAPGTVTPLATSSSVTVQGGTGQIVAGHNLNLAGGDLMNAGTLAAGNDVNVTSASFTNQGTNTGTMTTTAGCASGYSGCTAGSTSNPNSQSYSYQQTNSNVTAGHDIVIAASAVSNTYGSLVAAHDVVIGGTGTTAAAPAQAGSVTNTSGAIQAGNDVTINAATLTNTIAAPVQVHQNYGSGTPFTGCTSNCEAYVDVQSASPATITANHNVNLTAGTFGNTGSLVTALNNVTINASGSASSENQYLNAYWSSGFTHYGTPYATWGCANNPSLCQQLYGSAYSASAAQDPAGLPSSVGLPDFVPGTIQAGNTLSINSPTLTNTGNVIGQSVALQARSSSMALPTRTSIRRRPQSQVR